MRKIFAENKNFSTPRCREINKSQAIFFLLCKSHAFSSRQLNYREFPLIILTPDERDVVIEASKNGEFDGEFDGNGWE